MADVENVGGIAASLIIDSKEAVQGIRLFGEAAGLSNEKINEAIKASEAYQQSVSKLTSQLTSSSISIADRKVKEEMLRETILSVATATDIAMNHYAKEIEVIVQSKAIREESVGILDAEINKKQEVAQVTQTYTEKIQAMASQLASGNLSMTERGNIEGKLQQSILNVASAEELAGGAYRKEIEILNQSRAVRIEANKAFEAQARHIGMLNAVTPVMTQHSGQARLALTGFSQIIQDLPYGIRGVGNNIEFFTQSLTGLIGTTGSVGGAFRAMLSVFTGPVGLLFIISSAVSLLTVLSMKFGGVKDKSKEAADSGLTDFLNKLKDINDIAKTGYTREMIERLTVFNESLSTIGSAQMPAGNYLTGLKNYIAAIGASFTNLVPKADPTEAEKGWKAITEALKNQPDLLEQITEELKKAAGAEDKRKILAMLYKQYLIEHGNEIEKTRAKLSEMTDLQRQGQVFTADGKKVADEIIKLREHERELMRSTKDEIEDGVKKAELLFKSNKLTSEEYVAQLQHLAQIAVNDEQRLQIEGKITEEAKKSASARIELLSLQFENGKITLKQYEDQLLIIQQQTEDLKIKEDITKRIAAATKENADNQLRGEQDVITILELRFKNQELNTKSAEANAQTYRQMLVSLLDMTTDLKLQEQIKLRIKELDENAAKESLHTESEKVTILELQYRNKELSVSAYRQELNAILAQTTDLKLQQQIKLKLKEIDDNAANDAKKQHDKEMRNLDELISSTDKLGAALHRALGKESDDFLQKMVAALQIALQIAKALKKSEGPDGFGLGDVFSIVGDVAGVVALFDEGGYTGSGSRNQVAGVVHRGEIVFEKPLVDQYGGDLMALRSRLQRATSVPGYVSGGVVGGSSVSVTNDLLIAELRELRKDVRNLEIQQPIVLEGILKGQTFLRREMPGYEKFRGAKAS